MAPAAVPEIAREEAAPPAAAAQSARPAQPPPPSACRLALTETVAIAPSIADIEGENGCGGVDLVRLEAVVLEDRGRVPLKPAAILRCDMASAVAEWVRSDVTALAQGLGTRVSGLDNFNSYECRGRNRVKGAKVSEHGRGNALDLRAVNFANGQSLALTEAAAPRAPREAVRVSMCTRFNTVLGPGSDGYHEDHIHIDLAPRRNNYKICHWEVRDEVPVAAPLLPVSRPDGAPPREVAAAEPGAVAPEAEPKPEPAPEVAVTAIPPMPQARPKQEAVPKPQAQPRQQTAAQRSEAKPGAALVLAPAPAAKPKPRVRKRRAQSGPVMPWDFLR